jgi:hypothetical protein
MRNIHALRACSRCVYRGVAIPARIRRALDLRFLQLAPAESRQNTQGEQQQIITDNLRRAAVRTGLHGSATAADMSRELDWSAYMWDR